MKIPNIRFNLKFYDERGEAITIRTVEDLKNNFNVSDVYAYMMDGTLSRWLRSLREVECAECVERARSESAVRVQVEALLTAFDLEADNADMEAFLSSLTHETSAMPEQRDDSDCPVDSCRSRITESYSREFVQRLIKAIDAFKAGNESSLREIVSSLFRTYQEEMVKLLRSHDLSIGGFISENEGRHGSISPFLRTDFVSLIMFVAWTCPRIRKRVDDTYVICLEVSKNRKVLIPFVHQYNRDGCLLDGDAHEVTYVTSWMLDSNYVPKIWWVSDRVTLYDENNRDSKIRDLEDCFREKFAWIAEDEYYEESFKSLRARNGEGISHLVRQLLELDRERFLSDVNDLPIDRLKVMTCLAILKESLGRWKVIKDHFQIDYGRDMFGHTGPFVSVGHLGCQTEITAYFKNSGILEMIMHVMPYCGGSRATVFDGSYPIVDKAFEGLVS